MKKRNPSAKKCYELLAYDPYTGELSWKGGLNAGRIVAGRARAFTHRLHNTYYRVAIDGKQCMAHRLAWIIAHGRQPAGPIDHLNGIRSDNRLANLRECRNNTENMQNNPAFRRQVAEQIVHASSLGH